MPAAATFASSFAASTRASPAPLAPGAASAFAMLWSPIFSRQIQTSGRVAFRLRIRAFRPKTSSESTVASNLSQPRRGLPSSSTARFRTDVVPERTSAGFPSSGCVKAILVFVSSRAEVTVGAIGDGR